MSDILVCANPSGAAGRRRASLAAGLALICLAVPPASAQEAEPSPAALLFGKKCGGCHTLGQGDRNGPDLLHVDQRRDKAWISGFVRDPSAYFNKGDKAALELLERFDGMEMPPQSLTDQELEAVLAYVADCGKKGGCQVISGKLKPASQATPGEVSSGQALFEGRQRLSKGGPPCFSCHNVRGTGLVGGGTLAKDLTHVYARMGDPGLSAALSSTPFPLMKDIYGEAPLSTAEAFQLKAFLYESSKDGTAPRRDRNFVYAGAIGLFLSLGLIGLVWAGRIRGVRLKVVRRGIP
ncbi:MAG: cytochrome c [Myxococcales bacterium]|nr:cytochrome c [Myxococcales bacterium]